MSTSCGWFPMDRDEIAAWVKAHEAVLSANLAELAHYPMPFRKIIIAMTTADKRVALWREHLDSFVDADGELNAEQRAFVIESSAALPELLVSREVRNAWESRAAILFARELRGRIFETLGPREPPGGLPLPADAQPKGAG